MRTDASVLEIIRNHYSAICCGMCSAIERTSYSSYVTESADFATGLIATNGEFFAYPKTAGVTIFMGLTLARTIAECGGNESMREGDIIITNDPYNTDGLSTHLPDVHVIKPVFADGKLLCYAWSFVHTADIGGSVPTSLTPKATDIQMEGLRIPPVRLYRAGQLVDDVRRIILTSSRQPQLLMGDIDSMMAAVNTAEARLHEAVAKFGADVLRASQADLIEQARERARKVLAVIPNGTYSFEDYLDDDMESSVPIRLAVDATAEGGRVTLDFSRCDPQVGTAFNLITNGSHHPYIYQGLINFIISQDPFIPVNGGLTEPIEIVAPEGTVVNALYPAAGGLRHPVSVRLYNAVLGAFAQVIPQLLQAAGGGPAAIVTLSVPDDAHGGAYRANVVEPMGGGGGGMHGADGVDGITHETGFLRNTPIESLEKRTDILVRRYELLPDSAGAGQWRGGNAIRLDFETLHARSLVGARGQERLRFAPWGLAGGQAGACGSVVLNPETPREQVLSKIAMLPFEPGDVISLRSPSGGGWGDPKLRDAAAVLADVRSGLLSMPAAREHYGVVVRAAADRQLSVDTRATNAARAAMSAAAGTYGLGTEREAYEQVWTPAASDALAVGLRALPVAERPAAKHAAHAALGGSGQPVSAADVEAWLARRLAGAAENAAVGADATDEDEAGAGTAAKSANAAPASIAANIAAARTASPAGTATADPVNAGEAEVTGTAAGTADVSPESAGIAALREKVAADQPVSNEQLVSALKGAIKARSKVTYLIWKELQQECPEVDATALLGRVYRAWGAACGETWEGVHDAASALLAQTSKGGYLTFQQQFVCAGAERAQKDFGFCPHMEALDELGATPEEKRAFCQDILSEGDYGNLDPHPGLTLTFEHQIGAGDDHCSYVITAN